MALTTMYAGKTNSPATTLSIAATSTDISITVSELSGFPTDPNLAVLGTGSDAETILYSTMSAAAGAGTLGAITRAFQGTAKAWAVNTPVARRHTAYDYDTLRANVTTLDTPNASILLMPGGANIPISDPATLDQAETAIGVNYLYGEFSQTVLNKLQWTVFVPDGWDGTNLYASFKWTAVTAEAGNVKWDLYAYRFADSVDINTALPYVTTGAVDVFQGTGIMHRTAFTGAFTITGTGNYIVFELRRDYATDTLDAAARLLGIEVKYARSQTY